MPLKYKVVKSGGEGRKNIDYTVIFETAYVKPTDISEICQQAESLLEERDVASGEREISIFSKNNRVVVSFHYKNDVGLQEYDEYAIPIIEADFEETVQHLCEILQIFDEKPSQEG